MKLIYSGEPKFINDSLKQEELSCASTIIWNPDLEEFENISLIQRDVNQISFFNNSNVVIIKNVPLFKKTKKQACLQLIKILTNAPKQIILTVNEDKVEIPSEVTHLIESVSIPKLNYRTINGYIEKTLKQYGVKYNQEQVNLIKNKIGNDPWIIESEIRKLAMYNKNITNQMIENNMIDYSEQNIFKMIEWVIKDKADMAIIAFDELCPNHRTPDEIISIMVAYLFKIKVIFYYYQINSQTDMKTEFKISDFQEREYLALMRLVTIDKINQIINNLIKLDKGIKQGLYDPYIKLRLMIAGGFNG